MKKRASYPKGYIFATILFVVVTGIFLLLCNIVYNNGRQIYRHGFTEVNAAYTIRASLASISNRFQMIRLVAEQEYDSDRERGQKIAEKTQELAPKINNELDNLRAAMTELKNISDLSEEDKQNIRELDAAVNNLIDVSLNTLNSGKAETSITPEDAEAQAAGGAPSAQKGAETSKQMSQAQNATFTALEKALGRWRAETEVELASSRKFHVISNCMMAAIMAVVSISIIMMGFFTMRKENEVLQQKEMAEYQESRAAKAKAKTEEIAYTNLIMDCGNRYSLTEYINEQLKSETPFFAASFELVDFNGILSMIGYEQVDKYMAETASKIQSAFQKDGVLFTTTGEDFIFIFDESVSGTAVPEKAGNIRKLINDMLVASTNIGSPVTGAVVYSENFKGKTADALLTALHSVNMQSAATGQLILQ